MPGLLPININEPGTIPPPNTLFSSASDVRIRVLIRLKFRATTVVLPLRTS